MCPHAASLALQSVRVCPGHPKSQSSVGRVLSGGVTAALEAERSHKIIPTNAGEIPLPNSPNNEMSSKLGLTGLSSLRRHCAALSRALSPYVGRPPVVTQG